MPGFRKISWAQLRNADVALWHAVAQACEDGCKPKPDTVSGLTQFEEAFKLAMLDPEMRMKLMFHPIRLRAVLIFDR